jgi:predicted hydrocarbon binding protein
MDHSTRDVTLLSGFLFDVAGEYQGRQVFHEIDGLLQGFDPRRSDVWVPMSTYNRLCEWVEQRVGSASIQRAGEAIGSRLHTQMVRDGVLVEQPTTPSALLHELQRLAGVLIRDPLGRGWQILDERPFEAVARRTQTFNCTLQEGVLRALFERAGVSSMLVEHVRCTRRGDPYCDFRASWLPPSSRPRASAR